MTYWYPWAVTPITPKELKDFDTKVTFQYILSRDEISRLIDLAAVARPTIYGDFTHTGADCCFWEQLDSLTYRAVIDLSHKKITLVDKVARIPTDKITSYDHFPAVLEIKKRLDNKEIISPKDISLLWKAISQEPTAAPRIPVDGLQLDSGLDFSDLVVRNQVGKIIAFNFSGLHVENIEKHKIDVGSSDLFLF